MRASYTFGDPNLAGNYLVTSLFVMVACQRPRDPASRRIGYVLVLVAIGLHRLQRRDADAADRRRAVPSRSHIYRRRGAARRAGVLAVAALLAAMLVRLRAAAGGLRRRPRRRPPPASRCSATRSAAAGAPPASARTILGEGKSLFLQGNATGVGPARTKATLAANQAPYVKEAHNDYLATLLERGLIGALGLLLLGAAVATRCWRLLNAARCRLR